MQDFFDNKRILEIIWKRKFHFIAVGVIAVILSAIFSGPRFITPKFRASARIYPTNLWVLSNESETEQMLEILNSRDIKLRMMETFDLWDVYKISRNDPLQMTYLMAIYNKNVSARKTEFETVEVKVMDEHPIRAANMCDSIIHFYNLKVKEIHSLKNWEMVKISKNSLDQKQEELNALMKLITETRKKYGILDYQSQVEEITRGYMTALANNRGNTADAQKIKKMYDNLAEKGAEVYHLENKYNSMVHTIDSLQTIYETNLVEAQKEITYCHIVEAPIVPDKKAYPVRWVIVAFSTLSAVFLALLIFLLLDYRKTS